MKTKIQELLNFAKGKKSNELKGLIYNYKIVDDKVEILFCAVVGDGTKENCCVFFNGVRAGDRIPSQKEIEQALNEYIDLHGREKFHIGMVYDPNEFIRKNCDL
jgi:hypothetical protein